MRVREKRNTGLKGFFFKKKRLFVCCLCSAFPSLIRLKLMICGHLILFIMFRSRSRSIFTRYLLIINAFKMCLLSVDIYGF